MTGVRRLRAGETALLRELRLAALHEAPDAFARTLADALTQPGTYWTDGNLPAQTLYERLGFVATGRRDTLPSNPALATVEMRLPLGNGSSAP